MRTPAQIARALGWPEAMTAREVVADILGPTPEHIARRIIARSRHPHLRVGKGRLYSARRDGRWWWEIALPSTVVIDRGTASSWREALAVGLAALEHASIPRS